MNFLKSKNGPNAGKSSVTSRIVPETFAYKSESKQLSTASVTHLPSRIQTELASSVRRFSDVTLLASRGNSIETASNNCESWIRVVQPPSTRKLSSHLNINKLEDVRGNNDTGLLDAVATGLDRGFKPLSVEDGINGAMYLKNGTGSLVAIFKPQYNPTFQRRSFNESLLQNKETSLALTIENRIRKGVKPSEEILREVAAYVLDYGSFAGVPETQLVKIYSKAFLNAEKDNKSPNGRERAETCHDAAFFPSNSVIGELSSPRFKWIKGSLQEFAAHTCSSEDMSSSRFPLEQVQRIAAFDLRLVNLDRHAGNILVCLKNEQISSEVTDLIPIDHGLVLPEFNKIEDDAQFCWLTWKQCAEPVAQSIKEYISYIDAEKDAKILAETLENELSPKVILTLKIGTLLLKKAVLEFDMNLRQLGELFCNYDGESEVNVMINIAMKEVDPMVNEENFLRELKKEADILFAKMTKCK